MPNPTTIQALAVELLDIATRTEFTQTGISAFVATMTKAGVTLSPVPEAAPAEALDTAPEPVKKAPKKAAAKKAPIVREP